jgi:hypothetical protein
MDGSTTAAVACALAGGVWLLLGLVLVGRRVRFSRRSGVREEVGIRLPPARAADHGWIEDEWSDRAPTVEEIEVISTADTSQRAVLEKALCNGDPAVRRAAVAALGRLGDRHDWAIDGLIVALTEQADAPARVAAELDRLAPRVGSRVLPLLEHPASVVRFYAVRLLARHGEVSRRQASRLVRDPSPNVRAAALETLRTVATGDALRSALQLLDDPHPHVRAHACRTACSISGRSAAPVVVPLLADGSWEVREAARKALVSVGREVAPAVLPALDHQAEEVRRGAALVLQDVGVVDELLAAGDESGLVERIFVAGGERVRSSAAARARRRMQVRRGPRPLASGAES